MEAQSSLVAEDTSCKYSILPAGPANSSYIWQIRRSLSTFFLCLFCLLVPPSVVGLVWSLLSRFSVQDAWAIPSSLRMFSMVVKKPWLMGHDAPQAELNPGGG